MEAAIGRHLHDDETVHHINGNKRDNGIENLSLMKVAEHRKLHGVRAKVLNSQIVREIKADLAAGMPRGEVMAKYNISPTTVRDIRIGKTWGNVKPIQCATGPWCSDMSKMPRGWHDMLLLEDDHGVYHVFRGVAAWSENIVRWAPIYPLKEADHA